MNENSSNKSSSKKINSREKSPKIPLKLSRLAENFLSSSQKLADVIFKTTPRCFPPPSPHCAITFPECAWEYCYFPSRSLRDYAIKKCEKVGSATRKLNCIAGVMILFFMVGESAFVSYRKSWLRSHTTSILRSLIGWKQIDLMSRHDLMYVQSDDGKIFTSSTTPLRLIKSKNRPVKGSSASLSQSHKIKNEFFFHRISQIAKKIL